MNIENNNTFKNIKKSPVKLDYSGLFILIALSIQALALIPLVITVSKKKTAEEISMITPIMFLFSFIIFSVIAFTKQYFLPLIIFFIGIVLSAVLLIQKIMYERNKETTKNSPMFNLSELSKEELAKLEASVTTTPIPSTTAAPATTTIPAPSYVPGKPRITIREVRRNQSNS